MVKVLKKVKRLGEKPILTDELDAIFPGIGGLHQLIDEPKSFQRKITKGHEGFANVITGKLFLLHNQNLVAFFSQQGRGAGACRAAPDDNGVVFGFEGYHDICIHSIRRRVVLKLI